MDLHCDYLIGVSQSLIEYLQLLVCLGIRPKSAEQHAQQSGPARPIQNWQTDRSLPGKWVKAVHSNVVYVAFKSKETHQMLYLPSDWGIKQSNLSSIFQELSHFPRHSTPRNFTKKTCLEFSCGVSPTSSMQVFYQGI